LLSLYHIFIFIEASACYLRLTATLSILATVLKHLVGMAIFEFRPTAIGRWRF